MEPTLTIEDVSRILQLSRRSLNDPAFRARIGLRSYRLGRRSVRFLTRDVQRVLRAERGGGEPSGQA